MFMFIIFMFSPFLPNTVVPKVLLQVQQIPFILLSLEFSFSTSISLPPKQRARPGNFDLI